MQNPSHFVHVASESYLLVIVFSTMFSLVIYLFFGSFVKPLSLLNMCEGECSSSALLAQGLLVANIMFTYPLIVAPLLEMLPTARYSPFILRSGVILFTAFAAGTFNQLPLLVDLTSGIALTYCAFVVAPLLDLASPASLEDDHWSPKRSLVGALRDISRLSLLKILPNLLLMAFGVFSGVAATMAAFHKER